MAACGPSDKTTLRVACGTRHMLPWLPGACTNARPSHALNYESTMHGEDAELNHAPFMYSVHGVCWPSVWSELEVVLNGGCDAWHLL